MRVGGWEFAPKWGDDRCVPGKLERGLIEIIMGLMMTVVVYVK